MSPKFVAHFSLTQQKTYPRPVCNKHFIGLQGEQPKDPNVLSESWWQQPQTEAGPSTSTGSQFLVRT